MPEPIGAAPGVARTLLTVSARARGRRGGYWGPCGNND
jgi:hypothetical protein